MASLDFPKEARSSARALVESWGHDLDAPLEDIVYSAECDISNHFSDKNYGIEKALLAERRMRLLHETESSGSHMNCAEVGVNMFLIYDSLGASDKVRLARISPDERPTEHFIILHYDKGFDKMPIIVDPLFGHFGKMKKTKEGIVIYPENWLNSRAEGLSIGETMKANPGLMPTKIKTKVKELEKEEIIRYINYMNSPLGFFDYLKDGQKIKSSSDEEFKSFEATVQTKGHDLVVQAVCLGFHKPAYTLQRTYWIERDNLYWSDKEILHASFQWTTLTKVMYERSGTDEKFMKPKKEEGYFPMDLIHYFMIASRHQDFLSKEHFDKSYEIFMTNYELNKDNLKRYQDAIALERAGGESGVGFPDEKKIEEMKKTERAIKWEMAVAEEVKSLPETESKVLFYRQLHDQFFHARSFKISKPYQRFTPNEDPCPGMSRYADYMKCSYKDQIADLFASECVSRLLSQYMASHKLMELVSIHS